MCHVPRRKATLFFAAGRIAAPPDTAPGPRAVLVGISQSSGAVPTRAERIPGHLRLVAGPATWTEPLPSLPFTHLYQNLGRSDQARGPMLGRSLHQSNGQTTQRSLASLRRVTGLGAPLTLVLMRALPCCQVTVHFGHVIEDCHARKCLDDLEDLLDLRLHMNEGDLAATFLELLADD